MTGTTISSSYPSGITLATPGVYSPATISAGVTIADAAGSALYAYGGSGYVWTINNAGKVSGKGSQGQGIQIGAGGTDVQSGTVINQASASIYGARYGIAIHGPGIVSNSSNGTIAGGSVANSLGVQITGVGTVVNAGLISDATSVALSLADGSSVTNLANGTISAADAGVSMVGSGSITNAAMITASNGAGIYLGSVGAKSTNSFVTNQSGGSIAGKSVGINIYGAGTVANAAGATISGTIGIGIQQGNGTVINAGAINGSGGTAILFGSSTGNLVVVLPGAIFGGYVGGGGGGIDLAAGAGTLTSFGSLISNFGSLQFDKGAQWTIEGSDSASSLGTIAIHGFAVGDTIDVTGVVANGGTWTSGTLTLTENAVPVGSMNILGGFASSDFHFSDNGVDTFVTTDLVPCYRAGTCILTPSGEVLVEDFAIGDLVVTQSGEARPIKWIGRRGYQGRFIAGNRDVLPIRFTAGALDDGVPNRDLDVSPKHAMFVDNVLVPAELLINGTSVRQLEDADSVEYVHIELASHDIIIANGAASETFVDCDSRGMFHNAADYRDRYPDDPGPIWKFCAPRVEAASELLVAIRARLAARAGVSEGHGPPNALQGNIECCDRFRASGWVFDPTYPTQRVRLEICYDGAVIGHAMADRYRHDLEAVGYLGDGCCSFSFVHPVPLRLLSARTIEIRRAADGAPMPGSPVMLPAVTRFDGECRAVVTQLLQDVAQTAVQPSDLDDVIGYLMQETEQLLAARARLDGGARANVTNIHQRWGSLLPIPSVGRAAPDLRPHALFVDELLPARGMSGGYSAAIDHMCSMMRLGFDVSFMASRDIGDSGNRATMLAELGISVLVAPWYASIEEALRRQSGRIDVVYLHRAGNAAAYGRLVRQCCPQALLVYGVADLHHVRMRRQGSVEDRPEVTRRAEHMRFEEMVAARTADVVITHSPAEAALLRAQLPGLSVAVVPWSVPVRASGNTFLQRDGVVFVGNYGHEPNLDAVQWLAQEIVPLVSNQEPAIGFRIVGHGLPQALRRLAQPGLEMVGPTDALEALLDTARLTIAPLRYGAGLKAKVLESFAAGVPCVGTSIAFEGMALPAVLRGCIADTPDTLAAAVVRLYRDEAMHAAAAEAGRRYVQVNCCESSVDAAMQSALAPALRRWAGIAGDFVACAPEIRQVG
jgi:glycosyltransferase involved in cell wall biosynthesis